MGPTDRILLLKERIQHAARTLSLDQALIITRIYRDRRDLPVHLLRAEAFRASANEIPIAIDPQELIVGNRTPGIRSGVVFPEAGISWLSREIESLPYRPQDRFEVSEEDIRVFRSEIEPFWKGRTMEDHIYQEYGAEIHALEKVVKINQKDHAQGHICPDVESWLRLGPSGLKESAFRARKKAPSEQSGFFESVIIALTAASDFMIRYADLAIDMASDPKYIQQKADLEEISRIARKLSQSPPDSFREAIQSAWFLFVLLQLESNASSFSPGRMDQYLLPYYQKDLADGVLEPGEAQELIDALFIKFNQIVYMRNSRSARYFAGFPIGFNVTLGGQSSGGDDVTNELSFRFLKAQEHVGLPQPNLTARLHKKSPDPFILECSRIIGMGTGMPQIMNDESVVPSLEYSGLSRKDALNYAAVGCVELSSQGNFLGWSDAAMFNMVKVLELTMNNGACLQTGKQMGPMTGELGCFKTFRDFENAYTGQLEHFTGRMIKACEVIEEAHQKYLPSPFLSSVVNDCIAKGTDVTQGGAKYNYSGIQAIQVANLADSLASIRKLVYEEQVVSGAEMLGALRADFSGFEQLRHVCMRKVPKYGNDVDWVDQLGARWVRIFSNLIRKQKNFRGGDYQMGLYTVSAHIPMGENVGATPDGRRSGEPLADGGTSPMYGQDKLGPTAVFRSVSRIDSLLAGNGTLLNMKFLPGMFQTRKSLEKFASLLRGFIRTPIHHVQFNVVSPEDLMKAKSEPEKHSGLIVRVAGYSAYFIELAADLQDEIIARTNQDIQ